MSSLVNKIIRPEILALSAYHVPPAKGLIKLDAMENPYPLPPFLREEISQIVANAEINRYPDPHAAHLKQTLRVALSIPDGMDILLGNGSDEIIQIIALATARPGAKLLTVEPGFAMFRMIAAFANMPYLGIPLLPDFSLDVDRMLDAISQHQPAVIFLAYPNNPSGNLFDVEALCRITEASSALVVIDEAYHPFADKTFLDKLPDYPNLLVMRTLSKLGLAGLRLGLLIGRPEWLMHFEKIRLPYNIGVVTQLIAAKVMRHFEVLRQQACEIKQNRAILMSKLAALDGVEVFRSDANFILFRVNHASKIFQALIQQGILIKNLDNTHPLLKNCLRVTIGTVDENTQFLTTISSLINSD
ncbi:MAG: histidinol-phosphate transaminase [Nitrosomonas sp.]|nr:histidinol-phosphate transaminase [Nitrosomonas sp.]